MQTSLHTVVLICLHWRCGNMLVCRWRRLSCIMLSFSIKLQSVYCSSFRSSLTWTWVNFSFTWHGNEESDCCRSLERYKYRNIKRLILSNPEGEVHTDTQMRPVVDFAIFNNVVWITGLWLYTWKLIFWLTWFVWRASGRGLSRLINAIFSLRISYFSNHCKWDGFRIIHSVNMGKWYFKGAIECMDTIFKIVPRYLLRRHVA